MKKMYKNILKYPNAFTLAEVLITLVIIGVIAALTVPTLMKNTQNQEFVTGVKKAYSTLGQALANISRNNDAAIGDYSFMNNVDFIDEFAKVTNVIKKCSTTSECFGANLSGIYKNMNNTNSTLTDGKVAITSDGFIYTYSPITPSNKIVYGITNNDRDNAFGRIAVDINGRKNPNIIGRDVFIFYVVNDKGIVPAGSASTADCVKTNRGLSCSSKVIRENAMNY